MEKLDTVHNVTTEVLFVRPREAAVMLSISRAKCYELVAAGVLPSVKIGGSIRVPVSALRKLAEGGER